LSIEIPQWVVQDWVSQKQREWEPRLRALDPGLRLIPPFQNPPHPGMKANRWHLARFTDIPGFETFIPIEDPEGGFREMDEAMYDALKRADLQSPRSVAARERERRLRQEAYDSSKRREKEDRVGELAERLESAERVSIRVP